MLKMILIITTLGVFLFGQGNLSFAMMCHGQDKGHSQHQSMSEAESGEHEHKEIQAESEAVTPATTKETVDVGNKICPVSGEKIDEKMKTTYEYEGKIYNFCCPMCIEEFKKDPEKYIKKIEEELQAQTKEEGEAMPASSESESMHKEHHH